MNYYKILNKDEKHFKMQYKTGLNTDVLSFKPSGDCEKGGIYFAGQDILAFLNHGPWLRKVIIPEGEEIYENPGYPKKFKAHRVILTEREGITLEIIKKLINEGADIHAGDDVALRFAAEWGYLEIVKLLLKYGANTHAMYAKAFYSAASNGHSKVVKLLKEHM